MLPIALLRYRHKAYKIVSKYLLLMPRLLMVQATSRRKMLTLEETRWVMSEIPTKLIAFRDIEEPMLNPNLPKIIHWLSSKKVDVVINTNGEHYTEENIKDLEGRVVKTNIKTQNLEEMEATKLVGASKIHLCLTCVADNELLPQLLQWVELAKKVGARSVAIQKPLRNPSNNSPDFSQHSMLLKKINSRIEELGLINENPLKSFPFLGQCYAPFSNPTFLLDGSILACCYMADSEEEETYGGEKKRIYPSKYIAGNLNTLPFKEIWKGPTYKEIRRTLRETPYPEGTTLKPMELNTLRLETKGEFSYCRGCLRRWKEASI